MDTPHVNELGACAVSDYDPAHQVRSCSRHLCLPSDKLEILFLHGLNLSYLCPFDAFKNARAIYLQDNNLSVIPTLDSCQELRSLHLQRNRVRHISGLPKLNLRELDLSFNCLASLAPLGMPHSLEHISPGELINLESLNLSSNEFCSAELCALSSLRELKVLEISGNNIIELPEQFKLPALRLLDLRENPICNKPDYRQDMLARLPELRFLDDALVKRGSPETQQADYPNVSLKNPHATYDAEKMNELRQIQKQYYAETC